MIQHASNQRYTKDAEDEQDENIIVNDEWMALLQAHPFQSQKKGKFINLLKKGSKKQKEMKPKKKYQAFDIMGSIEETTLKRKREEEKKPQDSSLLDPKLTTKERKEIKEK